MIKRYLGDGLIQLAIVLSLLRTDVNNYFHRNFINYPEVQEIVLGQSLGYTQTNFHNSLHVLDNLQLHPKSLINEDEISSVLRRFGQLDRTRTLSTNINAFLADHETRPVIPYVDNTASLPVVVNDAVVVEELADSGLESGNGQELPSEASNLNNELTHEDMDLIDVLWRQDIDLGIGREFFDVTLRHELEREREIELHKQRYQEFEQELMEYKKNEQLGHDAQRWLADNYYQDGETGEYIPMSQSFSEFSPLTSANSSESEDQFTFEEAFEILDRMTSSVPPQEPVFDDQNGTTCAPDVTPQSATFPSNPFAPVSPYTPIDHTAPSLNFTFPQPYAYPNDLGHTPQTYASDLQYSPPLFPHLSPDLLPPISSPTNYSALLPNSFALASGRPTSHLSHNPPVPLPQEPFLPANRDAFPPTQSPYNDQHFYHNQQANYQQYEPGIDASSIHYQRPFRPTADHDQSLQPIQLPDQSLQPIQLPDQSLQPIQLPDQSLYPVQLPPQLVTNQTFGDVDQLSDLDKFDDIDTGSVNLTADLLDNVNIQTMSSVTNQLLADQFADHADVLTPELDAILSALSAPVSDPARPANPAGASGDASGAANMPGLIKNATLPSAVASCYDNVTTALSTARHDDDLKDAGIADCFGSFGSLSSDAECLSHFAIGITDDIPAMCMMDIDIDEELKHFGEIDEASDDSAVSLTSHSPLSQTTEASDGTTTRSESPYDVVIGATGGGCHSPGRKRIKSESTDVSEDVSFYESGSDDKDTNSSSSTNSSVRHAHCLHHNHTYPIKPDVSQPDPKINRKKKKSSDTSRDDSRLHELQLPYTSHEIITSSVDEFNDMISRQKISKAKIQAMRDIRRRGKNKVAAQNCRKRKINEIFGLTDELSDLQDTRDRLRDEREKMAREMREMRKAYRRFYDDVFRSLRDENGNAYDPERFSIEETADGELVLTARNAWQGTQDTGHKRKRDT